MKIVPLGMAHTMLGDHGKVSTVGSYPVACWCRVAGFWTEVLL